MGDFPVIVKFMNENKAVVLKSDEFIRIDDELKEKLIKILGNDNVKLIL